MSGCRNLICALTVAMAGCAGTTPRVSNVFDDLVHESTTSGASSLFNIKSSFSMSGIGPARTVGSYAYQPDRASPTHSVGISPKWSHVVRRRYPVAESDFGKLKGLGQQYEIVLRRATHFAQLSVNVAAAEGAPATPEGEKLACRLLGIKEPDCAAPKRTEALATLKAREAEAEKAFHDAKERFNEQSSIANVVVMRWEKREGAEGDATYGPFAQAAGGSASGNSGIAIFGDIMIDTLFVGEDFLDLMGDRSKAELFGFTRTSIATYVVSARHVEYVSDASIREELAIRAKLSQQQLETLSKALLAGTDATEATLALTYARMGDLGNRGILRSPVASKHNFCFMPSALHEVRTRQLVPDEHSAIYVVQAQLSTVTAFALARSESSTDWARGKYGTNTSNQVNAKDEAKPNTSELQRQATNVENRCGVEDVDPRRPDAKLWEAADRESFKRRWGIALQ